MKWLRYEPDSPLDSTASVISVTEELETPCKEEAVA